MCGMGHNKKYWDMFAKEKITQGWPKNFSKMFFELINSFMSSKPCFNPPHMRDFMNLNDDVYHTPTYHVSSSCDDHEIIEEFNNEEVVELDA